MQVEELEASLHDTLDPAMLAQYARALEGRGDPRGELIALDLQIQAHGASPALVRRHKERLVEWLGVAAIAGRRWNPRRFTYGLLDDYGAFGGRENHVYLQELYASKAAPFLRGVTMRTALSAAELDLLVARPHPWLRRLALDWFANHAPSKEWLDAFPKMTPRLEELTVVGWPRSTDGKLLFTMGHPNVRRLVLEQSPIHLSGSHFPAVVELDVTTTTDDFIDFKRHLPSLRQLDFSRCDPGSAAIKLASVPEGIERVRIPAPQTTW